MNGSNEIRAGNARPDRHERATSIRIRPRFHSADTATRNRRDAATQAEFVFLARSVALVYSVFAASHRETREPRLDLADARVPRKAHEGANGARGNGVAPGTGKFDSGRGVRTAHDGACRRGPDPAFTVTRTARRVNCGARQPGGPGSSETAHRRGNPLDPLATRKLKWA